MKTPILALLAATLILAGCGNIRDSRLNPLNWFGRSQSGPATLEPKDGYQATGDYRILVGEVTQMTLDKVPGGAILTAAGLPPTQGWWDAELRPVGDGAPVDGVLTFEFVVSEPREQTRVSTPQSREVTAGIFISDQKLAEVKTVVVQGERNSRTSRR